MAVETGTYQTFTTIGIREDLINLITNIAPVENYFFRTTGSRRARQCYHEWQTDIIASGVANAHVEGEIVTGATITPTVRTGNYCQILQKAFVVSNTNEAVEAAGRESEIAYQKAKYLRELTNDIEYALIINSASVSGASGTARQLKGVLGWITTNVTTASSAVSASGVNESDFNANLALIWAQGGQEPFTAIGGSAQKRSISRFTGNSTRFNEMDRPKVEAKVDIYMSDHGEVRVRKHRVLNGASTGTVVIFGDMGLWKKAFLRQEGWKELGVTGSARRFFVESELTLESLQEKGAGKMTSYGTS